ncbi:hypothetical protein NOGI109294_22495 [Nocardiopsis gilva]|uniref:Uncharacterized protein n=1 Tax=Nocardiopsis rhodophaea TaxID=280238 RepID=A0ABN2SUU7_9ACTN|nr:hypothetical protein [Nocardiopsis gilva]
MSSKPQESKASPLGKDVKFMVIANITAIGSMALFAAMGLSIAHAATGVGF